MDMAGEKRIEASRDVVWAALNDPEILRKCIPGCQELQKHSDTEMTAVAVIKVGPVSARFQGAVTLSDLDPPNGYRITGEGQGGVAGFAKGSAEVLLTADGDATILRYSVSAQIGGKLSQLGGRLIDATSRKMSDAFFKRFAEEIATSCATAGSGEGEAPGVTAASQAAAPAALPTGNESRPQLSTGLSSAGSYAAAPWMSWLNIAVLAAAAVVIVADLLIGSPGRLSPPAATGGLAVDLSSAVLLFLVLSVGYLAGRQHEASRANMSDRQLLLALLTQRTEKPEP